jgi:ABC-type antimicrobial peptide transport system permease subunit
MSYVVSQRSREMGVQLALGATTHDIYIYMLVLGRGAWLAIAGAGFGVVAAVQAMRSD